MLSVINPSVCLVGVLVCKDDIDTRVFGRMQTMYADTFGISLIASSPFMPDVRQTGIPRHAYSKKRHFTCQRCNVFARSPLQLRNTDRIEIVCEACARESMGSKHPTLYKVLSRGRRCIAREILVEMSESAAVQESVSVQSITTESIESTVSFESNVSSSESISSIPSCSNESSGASVPLESIFSDDSDNSSHDNSSSSSDSSSESTVSSSISSISSIHIQSAERLRGNEICVAPVNPLTGSQRFSTPRDAMLAKFAASTFEHRVGRDVYRMCMELLYLEDIRVYKRVDIVHGVIKTSHKKYIPTENQILWIKKFRANAPSQYTVPNNWFPTNMAELLGDGGTPCWTERSRIATTTHSMARGER